MAHPDGGRLPHSGILMAATAIPWMRRAVAGGTPLCCQSPRDLHSRSLQNLARNQSEEWSTKLRPLSVDAAICTLHVPVGECSSASRTLPDADTRQSEQEFRDRRRGRESMLNETASVD